MINTSFTDDVSNLSENYHFLLFKSKTHDFLQNFEKAAIFHKLSTFGHFFFLKVYMKTFIYFKYCFLSVVMSLYYIFHICELGYELISHEKKKEIIPLNNNKKKKL